MKRLTTLNVLVNLAVTVLLSGCVSSLDRLLYGVQDEIDLSGDTPREEAAILEANSTSRLILTQSSCFFSVAEGEEVHNYLRMVVRPGITKVRLRCYVNEINAAARYARLFEVNLLAGHTYAAGLAGSAVDATDQCLFVTDSTDGDEVARDCDALVSQARKDNAVLCDLGLPC